MRTSTACFGERGRSCRPQGHQENHSAAQCRYQWVGVVEARVVEGFDLLGGELDVEHRRRPGWMSWSAESGNDLTIYVTPGQSSTLSREEYIYGGKSAIAADGQPVVSRVTKGAA